MTVRTPDRVTLDTAPPPVPHAVETPAPRRDRFLRLAWRFAPAIAGTLALAVVVVWTVRSCELSPRAFLDLDVYRIGVHTWWSGGDMYGVLPDTVIGQSFPFTYPPVAALVLSAVVWLPWQDTIIAMTVISLCCLAAVVLLTIRAAWPSVDPRRLVFAASVALPASLLLEPVGSTIWFGQVNLVLLALVAADCLVVAPRWPRGVLVGIAAAVKLTPAVFVVYFLVRRDYRSAVRAAVAGVVATAVGFAANWSGSLSYWFSSSGGAHAVGDTSFIANQSLDGALYRLPLPDVVRTGLWGALAVGVLALAVLGVRRAHREGSAALAMSVTGAFGLLVSPISWDHHWVYAVPAVLAVGAEGVRRWHPGWLAAAAGAAAVLVAAPFQNVPASGVLTFGEQVRADAFAVTAVVLLALYAFGRPRDSHVTARGIR